MEGLGWFRVGGYESFEEKILGLPGKILGY